MEMEAVQKEKISLESQISALKKQINDLTSELDSQKTKVLTSTKADIRRSRSMLLPGRIRNDFSTFFFQVSSIKKDHDEVQSELNMARRKIKECDSQITSIVKDQQGIQHKITEANLERKRMENEVIC